MREGKMKKCKYAKIENRIVEYRKRENVEMQENTEFKARHLRTFVYTFVLLIVGIVGHVLMHTRHLRLYG